jgi:hypothetical protein
MSRRAQEGKDRIISELVRARRDILEAASELSPAQQDEVFLGSWDAKDLLAHLVGWDLANIEATQAVLAGRLPAFYAHHDRDWRTYNARLVAEHRKDDFGDLVSSVEASHHRLLDHVRSIPAEQFDRDRGVRFKGWKVTIGRLLQAEADDEREHHTQIEAFRNQPPSSSTQGKGAGMGERILTKHPEAGNQGVNIERGKYDAIREAILESIRTQGEITFRDLTAEVRQRLEGRFQGSISWYVTTVKLDLEARGIIERIPNRKPQHLRLAEK